MLKLVSLSLLRIVSIKTMASLCSKLQEAFISFGTRIILTSLPGIILALKACSSVFLCHHLFLVISPEPFSRTVSQKSLKMSCLLQLFIFGI